MYLDERQVGEYRIFAVASLTARGRYVAGCAVKRMRVGDAGATPVYLEGAVSGGFGFGDPHAALRHALEVGHRELRKITRAGVAQTSNGKPT